ncbi:MAG: PEP-CTERM sorting domain-containing protein [Methyloprofundus sp.]|nr:PEP-CTERM sorting domain-containing protein [Methyloprofundus sp.]
MKNFKRSSALILSAGILWSSYASAALINGDFSSGFTGWQAETTDDIPPITATTLTPANYQINSAGALLSTSYTTNNIYGVKLYQDFNIPALSNINNTLALSLALNWTLSSNTGRNADNASALLEDTGSSLILDLAGGGTFDITDWAGKSVSLSFIVEDFDDIVDSLQVGNIAINETVVSTNNVPEPTSLMMLGVALLALRKKIS